MPAKGDRKTRTNGSYSRDAMPQTSTDILADRDLAFLSGGGELGCLIATFDWSSTSIGPISGWPQSLKTATSLILRSKVPIVMLWGEDGVMIYNDGYSEFAGGRHPKLLGSKVREGWPEVADFNDNIMKVCLGKGETLAYREQVLTLNRTGKPEQVWLDLDYSPVLDENGRPAGVVAIVIETTDKVAAERWRASERDRQRQMFEQAPGFMAMLSGPKHVFELTNAAYMQLVGHRDVIGLPVRQALPEIEGQGYFELLDRVFTTGEAFVGHALKAELQRTPGAPAEEHYIDIIYQPVRNPGGEVIGIFVQGVDVTDRLVAEQALRQSERRLQLSQNAAGIAALELDIASGTVVGSEGFWDLWGLSPRDSVHISVLEDIVVAEDKDVRSNSETRKQGTAVPAVEYRIRRADTGELRWLSRHIDFVHDETGKPVQMFGVMQDVTDRREAQARQELLTHELEHRIKNILAMVSAIASQTLRNSTDIAAASATFTERLRALANAHDILNKTRWTSASIREVVENTIATFPAERIAVSGPALPINPKMALTLALAVNELATNALKYGALSTPDGKVTIVWSLRPSVERPGETRLIWTWRERGGPPVTPPSRRGFGRFLIERVLGTDFGGSVEIDYNPDGVECVLNAPAPQLPTASY